MKRKMIARKATQRQAIKLMLEQETEVSRLNDLVARLSAEIRLTREQNMALCAEVRELRERSVQLEPKLGHTAWVARCDYDAAIARAEKAEEERDLERAETQDLRSLEKAYYAKDKCHCGTPAACAWMGERDAAIARAEKAQNERDALLSVVKERDDRLANLASAIDTDDPDVFHVFDELHEALKGWKRWNP